MKKKADSTTYTKLIHEIEFLVSKNLMKVDAEKQNIILGIDLWSKFDKQKQDNFFQNMAVYCKLKNSYDGILKYNSNEMRVFLKNEKDEVKSIYMYIDGKLSVSNL